MFVLSKAAVFLTEVGHILYIVYRSFFGGGTEEKKDEDEEQKSENNKDLSTSDFQLMSKLTKIDLSKHLNFKKQLTIKDSSKMNK